MLTVPALRMPEITRLLSAESALRMVKAFVFPSSDLATGEAAARNANAARESWEVRILFEWVEIDLDRRG